MVVSVSLCLSVSSVAIFFSSNGSGTVDSCFSSGIEGKAESSGGGVSFGLWEEPGVGFFPDLIALLISVAFHLAYFCRSWI